MDLLSQFGERLRELIADSGLTADKLSKAINQHVDDIYHWKSGKGKFMPSVANLIKLADYFVCSVDFLLGLEEENYLTDIKPRPPFTEWFRTAVESKGFTLYSLGEKTQMGTKHYYRWIKGESEPSIDSLVRIASVLDCSIDYLLGRDTV